MRESPSSQPRSSWPRSWLEAAGAALLLAPGLIWNQLSPTHLDLYHRLLPITAVVRALALDVLVLWLLAVLALRAIESLNPPNALPRPERRNFRDLLWALWLGLLASRLIAGLILAQLLSWQELSAGRAFALTAAVLLLIWLFTPRIYVLAVRGLRFAVLLFGFCIFWALPMLVMAGFAHQPRDHAEFQKTVPVPAAPHPRIVWLLFDELSWDQLFDHRWPGLDLPNFDRLRAQSVAFSNVEPDGYFTERIIPSLFLGKPIFDARSSEAGALRYQSAKGAPWQTFDENATLFADARRQGWTTGTSGDYNPYCRMLPNQLDACTMRLIVFGEHLSRDKSTWGNFTAPGHATLARTLHQRYEPAPSEAEVFASMMTSARQLVTNDSIDLAFAHLYLPHPPGFYDRKTGRVLIGGSYIDNLALADRSLGDLLSALAQTPSANQTTLILSSDHSWRVGIWRNGFGWTKEDEAASQHGHFDPRPTLMVRFPGESSPADVSHTVPLLSMHDMIERMITRELSSPEQLTTWAAQQ